MVFGLGLIAIGWAGAPLPAGEVYAEAVDVVRRAYLEPRDLDPHEMLASAALRLADDLHWLQVRVDDDVIVLSHGSGAAIGMVGAESLDGLPAALDRLAGLVVRSGYDLGDVDVSLSVLSGMVEALDRHSRVLTEERLERFETRLTGTQVGVGAFFSHSGDHLVVSELSEGGPAAVAGLVVGDHLLKIDGRSTVGMGPDEVAERIRGDAGTSVALAVSRNGELRTFTLARAEVVVPNVTWRVLPGSVGYVYIDHISQRTVVNLRSALDRLAAVGALERGLVVDLRGNTGGSMKESAFLADLFVRGGLLLRTAGKDGGPVPNLQAEMYAHDDGNEPDVPIVLVVDERTASGSEIFAGALVELGRAAVIGARTYGKGTVQKTYPLTDDVRLKLTVARYLLANGRSIDGGGIAPDVWMGRVAVRAGARGADVRFEGWGDAQTRRDWESRVPEVVIGDEEADLAVDIARRAVLSVTGPDRALLVEALEGQAAQARREQVARLASALAPTVDWSPERQVGGVVQADVALRAEPEGGGRWRLTASVINHGAPLHRALVQLSCPTAPYWDGVVIPVGALPERAQVVRSVSVEVPPGVTAREDAVDVRVVAEGREVRAAGEVVLPSGSEPLPELKLVARLRGPPGSAELTLDNLSDQALEAVSVSLGVPRESAVQLREDSARVARLGAASRESVSFGLERSGTGAVALDVVVETPRHGVLAAWPLALPADGREVALRAPRIEARPAVRASPVGRFVLPVVVSDDRALQHVVVIANGRKVAWAGPSATGRIELAARFPLVVGDNEVVVRATDDQGLVSESRLGIRGERTPDAVDAAL